jgi:uncharacterized protein YjiS (DUF1127 family)
MEGKQTRRCQMKNFITDICHTFVGWRARRRTVEALSALDDRQLRDIGVVRAEIMFVAAELAARVTPKVIRPQHEFVSAALEKSHATSNKPETEWRWAA